MMGDKFQKIVLTLAIAAFLASAGAYIKDKFSAYNVNVYSSGKDFGNISVTVSGAVEKAGTYALPKGSRVCDAIYAAGGLAPNANADSLDPDAVIADKSHITVAKEGEKIPTAVFVVNINTAGVHEMSLIPGIGETMAQRIVDYRTEHGKFLIPQDITRVKGIGERTFNKIKDYIKTEEQSQ